MISREALMESDFKLLLSNYETRDKVKLDAYIELIHRTVRFWSVAEFNKALDVVIRNLDRGQKPMPKDFQDGYHTGFRENAVSPNPYYQETQEQTRAYLMNTANSLGGKGARFVVDLVEKHRVNMPEDVFSILVQRAGDEPEQVDRPLEAILNIVKLGSPPVREQAGQEDPAPVDGSPEEDQTFVDWGAEEKSKAIDEPEYPATLPEDSDIPFGEPA